MGIKGHVQCRVGRVAVRVQGGKTGARGLRPDSASYIWSKDVEKEEA